MQAKPLFDILILMNERKKYLKGKRVLIMGLGRLGGGVATTNWLLRHGAKVMVTDLRTKGELKDSLKKISKKVPGVFGAHRKEDIAKSDILVINPAVRLHNPFVLFARKKGIPVENELTLFFRFAGSSLIGVTGTRGKTTTVHWMAHFLSRALAKDIRPIGNNPKRPFLKELDGLKKNTPATLELPSWQLELLPEAKKSPHIALITNLFPDHLNTYPSMEAYADAKANIFKWQTPDDFLILNYGNKWTPFFLSKKPKARIFYFSAKLLPRGTNGIFVKNERVVFQKDGVQKLLGRINGFERSFGKHNLENLLAATLTTRLFLPRFKLSSSVIKTLPSVPFRQEILLRSVKQTVVNDSAATTEEATIAALRRFCPPVRRTGEKSKDPCVLITGGTNKNLPYCQLAKEIKRRILPKHLVLLVGSATEILERELQNIGYGDTRACRHETLRECVSRASEIHALKHKTILFSPGAASFEKFKNEFDRGEQFSVLVKKYFQ